MNELDIASFRIDRLKDAIERVSGGDRTAFGRKLGYADGAYVRQLLAGTRPISEKTIRKIESLHGMAGWFEFPSKEINHKPPKTQTDWPFDMIDPAKVGGLSREDLIRLQTAIITTAVHLGMDIQNK